jgi:precorrin-6A synthase
VRTIHVIGIGAGNPDHLTLEAIRALNEVDVVFIVTKGDDKRELEDLRRELCDRHIERPDMRTVEITDPPRDRTAEAYAEAVEDWRNRRAGAFASAIRDELGPDNAGALLVWGDPAFYDSTLPIIEDILERGELELAYRVVPGISSLQSLAASHRITLTRVGRPLQITTGRRVADGAHDADDDILVMLDAVLAFRKFAGRSFDIYWGAYLGTADEILIAGPIEEVADRIVQARAQARARKGWIMDTYLLRRRG